MLLHEEEVSGSRVVMLVRLKRLLGLLKVEVEGAHLLQNLRVNRDRVNADNDALSLLGADLVVPHVLADVRDSVSLSWVSVQDATHKV